LSLSFKPDCHRDTNASLSYHALKGKDHNVATYLKEACKEAGFSMYLANCERRVSGGCDDVGEPDGWSYGRSRRGWYDDEEGEDENEDDKPEDDEPEDEGGYHHHIEVYDRSMDLTQVIGLDGEKISEQLDYGEQFIVQSDPFKGHAPDHEDYSGYTGNEGVSSTHFYKRTVCSRILTAYLAPLYS